MSIVDISFSKVNVLLCEIDVKLSSCPEVSKSGKSVSPRIGNILTQMQGILSHHFLDTSHTTNLWWDDASHEVWYDEEEGFSDENYSSLSTFGCEEEEENNNVASKEKDDNKEEGNAGKEDIGDDKEEDDQEEEAFSIADRVKVRRSRPRGSVRDVSITSPPPRPPSSSRSEEIGDLQEYVKERMV